MVLETMSFQKKNGNIRNYTLELIKIIGSPFATEEYAKPIKEEEVSTLYFHAVKNRIPLFFLDVLEKNGELFGLKSLYRKQYSRCLKIFDAMARVSEFLNSLDVEHAIFKSIKPFPDASVDVDTLIFDSEKYEKVLKSFSKAGWKMLGYGPQSTTFFDVSADVGVDLYREIAVSWVVYLDKRKLEKSAVQIMLPNSEYVSTLTFEADLVATIAHSLIKEQMYTLAEFYIFLRRLRELKMERVEKFIELINTNRLKAAKSFVSLTLALHKEAFGFIPTKLGILGKKLGQDPLEENRLLENGFQTPHKYHYLTIAKGIIGKLMDGKTRTGLAFQAYEMTKPHFAKRVLEGVLDHLKRETY